jgi:hypothetical protein
MITTSEKLPVISLDELQPSNANSKALADKIIDAIINGYVNPLDFAVKKKCIEEALELAFNNTMVKDAMIEEANKHSGKTTWMGAKIEACEVGIKYHFDKCGDPKLVELENTAGDLADKIKMRKEYLKKVDGKGEKLLVEDEVVEVFPPYKTSTTSIKVSLQK